MAIRGEGGGGERRIGALESSPEDFTVGHFILAKNHTGFSGVFSLCRTLTTPLGFEVHRILVPIDQTSRLCRLTVARPRDICGYFTKGR